MSATSSQQTLEKLVDLLDRVVREQVGESLADSMHRVRRLAMERRSGLPDAEERLIAELRGLDKPALRAVIRWLSLFFDVANLAEDRQRVRVLQQRDESAYRQGVPRDESIAAAVEKLKADGCGISCIQRWLDRLRIEPVFTAHPSEAKRRTTRQLLRRIRSKITDIDVSHTRDLERVLLADLTVLWQTDLVRPERPPVMSEVSRGLFFARTLWGVVPTIYRELRDALADAFPHHHFDVPPFMAFGTWIGGDRDGHPFVTSQITRQTLAKLRQAALENHLAYCREMLSRIVMSDQQIPSDDWLRSTVQQAMESNPEFAKRIANFSRFETYRQFLKLIEFRLEHSLDRVRGESSGDSGFASVDELRDQLMRLQESVAANRGERVAAEFVQPWLDLVNTFGFHFASLDIRQNSEVHRTCFQEILKQQGHVHAEQGEESLRAALREIEAKTPVERESLSDASKEAYETFLLLAEEVSQWGTRPFGGYVISMTHSSLDVVTVLWLWQTAWREKNGDQKLPYLPIIPLFETIEDLESVPPIMHELFQLPEYSAYLSSAGNPHQIVMVGYSDSTKDGGYLSACWQLHQAQEKLAEVANQHHVELTVFHGRGGALGRGGGPAARAIRSLPPEAVRGKLRVTEQGEVLAERYDDPHIAHRHLEQLIFATLLVSAQEDVKTPPAWDNAMSLMAKRSFDKYRELVQSPGFLDYFSQATPIGEIETLPIGSRPARRGARTSLGDLRAIPWTFAWTQSRHLLPAWYGFGTAVRAFADETDKDWSLLAEMYEDWPMFRAVVDNAELALAKADMEIARNYAALTEDSSAQEIWKLISVEFQRSRGAVLLITGRTELLAGIPWLNQSIESRNPYVDPLNLAQIELLSQQRALDEEEPHLTDLLRLTIQGIASGLRTTG